MLSNIRHSFIQYWSSLSTPSSAFRFEGAFSKMERHYDIFEIMPDGAPMWRAAVEGHENAIVKLQELA